MTKNEITWLQGTSCKGKMKLHYASNFKFPWFLLFVIWFFSSDLALSASDLKFPSVMLPLQPLKRLKLNNRLFN